LVVGQQTPYPLEKRDNGNFGSPSLPPTYYIKVKKDGEKLTGITMVQPEGEFEFNRIEEKDVPKIEMSVNDLLAKTIEALGGEANMRKINSRATEFNVDAVHQGVKGSGKSYQKAPNKFSTKTTLTALGKKIGWIHEFFDGTKGAEEYSFSRDEEYTGKKLEDIKVQNNFNIYLDWKDKYEKVEIVKIDKVGDEEVYVAKFDPKDASSFAVYISSKTFLPLKKRFVAVSSTSTQVVPIVEVYTDYRETDGLMIPFMTTSTNPSMGDIITSITRITHNVKISDKEFQK
jgi:hypothetical protein